MGERKQVMDMRSNTDGISNAESNEQQRKWTNNLWDKKAKDSLANYDPSRAHLNFEVTKAARCSLLTLQNPSNKRWMKTCRFVVSKIQTQERM